ncbi:MAG: transcription antitermination protein NusB [Candidatus Amulumruptor caecigallinarius]|nr:transcription antitermination protein NusB [Candidatus Amulumruptor caecigallinarius]MCM1395921.1 transcription antitermination protein NusB [Candidatus Amulumruptor caecigallinarius]
MKVVQLLYSYLLTKSEFKINPAPVNPTRDRAFAHTVYVDLLLMLLELGGYRTSTSQGVTAADSLPRNPRFNQSKMMRSLASNDDIRAIINRRGADHIDFDKALAAIYTAVTDSELYKKYLRARKRGLQEDVEFWSEIITTVIAPSEAFVSAARAHEGFTLKGMEQGVPAVIHTLNDFNDESNALTAARNALDHSLDKAYELYHGLLALPAEITRAYERRIEAGRNKFLPTDADLNPDTRLLDNKLVAELEADPDVAAFAEEHPGQWENSDLLIDHLLDEILQSDIYKDYLAISNPTLSDDAAFWRHVLRSIIIPDTELAEALESKSVYWNDDLDIMGTFAVKTFKRLGSDDEDVRATAILPKYKDDEDRRFGPELFGDVVEHYNDYRELIDSFIDSRQWDSERLAFMDVVIMCTAIAEMLNYPQIPIPVTLNEYIEIANSYSTPKSGKFVNGVLYSVINRLKEEGRLNRG